MTGIAERVEEVTARIAAVAERAGRNPADVTLVAVAKTFPASMCAEALAAGVTDLGENRAQELKAKTRALRDRGRWHFVGHLQTNKVRHVVGNAVLIHSVDRVDLADAINRRAGALGIVQNVLIEVNLANERSKSGVSPGAVPELAGALAALENVAVVGLMAMPPLTGSLDATRSHFKELARIRTAVTAVAPKARELSMGMSRDYEVAIEEGATIVRVGEAIFGPRRGSTAV